MLFIDLDQFKLINDSLGHAAGDQLLVDDRRPAAHARCGRATSSARFGGDEFTVLCCNVAGEAAGDRTPLDRGGDRRAGSARHRRGIHRPRASGSRSRARPTTLPRLCSATPTPRCTRPKPMVDPRRASSARTITPVRGGETPDRQRSPPRARAQRVRDPLSVGAVHRGVGVAEQRLGGVVGRARDRDPDARGHEHLAGSRAGPARRSRRAAAARSSAAFARPTRSQQSTTNSSPPKRATSRRAAAWSQPSATSTSSSSPDA